jgi:hypothetical protein
VDNVGDYPDYTFFIFPTSMSGGAAVMNGTSVPGYYKFASPFLYAILSSELPVDFDNDNFEPPSGALKCAEPFESVTELPDSDPTTEIETHYEVSFQDSSLVLTIVSEMNHSTGDVNPVYIVTDTTAGHEPLFSFIISGFAVTVVLAYLVGRKR